MLQERRTKTWLMEKEVIRGRPLSTHLRTAGYPMSTQVIFIKEEKIQGVEMRYRFRTIDLPKFCYPGCFSIYVAPLNSVFS